MRFHTILLVAVFLGIISASIHEYVFYVQKLDSRVQIIRENYYAKRFIAESFRNTCAGKGFENLEEWQLCCKEIFDLSYIGWSNVNEVLKDGTFENENLMYGKWTGSNEMEECSGEVYCRIDRSRF